MGEGAKEVTIGFDISSVCVGYAIFKGLELEEYGKYIQIGKQHGEKLKNFSLWLDAMLSKYKPEHVVIELPHGGGRGVAFTVLTMYVAMVYASHFRVLGRELNISHCLYPSAIKSNLGVMPAKNHDQNKEVMVAFINNLFRLSLRCNPTDKTKKTTDDDIADAIALVVAWLIRSKRDDGRYHTKPNRRGKRTKRPSTRRA